MKKSNVLFIAMIAVSVALIGAIMADNISSLPRPAAASSPVVQGSTPQGLPLHEARYWKIVHE